MLYLSTRNPIDAFTAQKVLTRNRASDGGLYLPMRMPIFSPDQIDALADKSFNSCVAEVLNLLFNTRLTGWDVDFCVGRYPVRLESMTHRIIVAQTWHNQEWDFSRTVRNLSGRLRQDGIADASDWTYVGVRIAVLFGIFGSLLRAGVASRDEPVDISVVTGDFSAPMAVWYAKKLGLPIGNIICSCNENCSVWDLFHHGVLRTDVISENTSTPEADVALPSGLERLIYTCGGYPEVQKYVDACRKGRVYSPAEPVFSRLRDGFHVCVVGRQRLQNTIANVYRTNSCLFSPYTALAHAGLQDYRVNTGIHRHGLILADKSPACTPDTVAYALGITAAELNALLE